MRSIKELVRKVHSRPNDPQSWLMLGIALAKHRENDKAADCFARVLHLDPTLIPTDPTFRDLATRAHHGPPHWLADSAE